MDLNQVYKTFPENSDCIEYLEHIRWNGIPQCPYCKSIKSTKIKNTLRYHCNTCYTTYSVTVKTIFHKSKLDLRKWLLAIFLALDSNDISSRKIAKLLQINKNTGWFVLRRIKDALLNDGELLNKIIEDNQIKMRE